METKVKQLKKDLVILLRTHIEVSRVTGSETEQGIIEGIKQSLSIVYKHLPDPKPEPETKEGEK